MNERCILVLGKDGQVGGELCRSLAPFGNIVAMGRHEVDLAETDKLARLVADIKPQVVFNAAAYTAVDRAESEPEEAHKINAIAPGVLAEAAGKVGAWFIHFSTDYVFDGALRRLYLESDAPNPLNVYGQSKLAGERAVQAAGGRHLIFRLSWVYGTRGNNFLLTLQRLARERDTLQVVNDQIGAPTWSRLIAEAMAQLSQRLLSRNVPDDVAGLYHLACGGQTSWHGFASRIMEQMPASQRRVRAITPISTAEYPTPARRPAWSVLDCSKVERVFDLRLPHWEDALRRVLTSE